jgi:hypothetical protein
MAESPASADVGWSMSYVRFSPSVGSINYISHRYPLCAIQYLLKARSSSSDNGEGKFSQRGRNSKPPSNLRVLCDRDDLSSSSNRIRGKRAQRALICARITARCVRFANMSRSWRISRPRFPMAVSRVHCA